MPLDGILPHSERVVPAQCPTLPFCGLAFVGEAPGMEEIDRLTPFCGPSGRIFDAILRSAGIDRRACFVTNVYSTKLEDNEVKKEKAKRGEGWSAFHEANLDRLRDELAGIGPTLIVALGATALQAICGTASLAQFRGSPRLGVGRFVGYKVFPTWHPAFILRAWKNYTIWLGDLMRARAELEIGPKIVWPHRVLNIAPSIEEVEDAGRDMQKGDGPLSCDIETGWGQIRGVSFAPNSEEAIYVPFLSLNTLSRSYWPTAALEKRAWQATKLLLECERPKLGQNFANYDIIWLLTKMGIRPRNYCHDLRLLHKALYPELPAGLGFMGSAHSQQGSWKAMAKHSRAKGDDIAAKRDE